jgi:hypothetical protein
MRTVKPRATKRATVAAEPPPAHGWQALCAKCDWRHIGPNHGDVCHALVQHNATAHGRAIMNGSVGLVTL